MKCLVIGGNRFVGLRVVNLLDKVPGIDLHVLNRTGQVAHVKNAAIYKGDRNRLETTFLDTDWDVVIDFACFNQAEAENALGFFKNVGRYIFISTVSVYDRLGNVKEDLFQPEKLDLTLPPAAPPNYQDGKRRAEAVFHQQNRFPVMSVRFPVMLGPDDYTHRLDFHIDRVKRSEPIFIPNMNAKISMIHAEDAANFIVWAMDKKSLTGPVNVASADPISLGGLMGQIELVTGIKPTLAKSEDGDNHSPYAPEKDWYMNTEKLRKAGLNPRPIADWLPGLIGEPPKSKPRFVH
jgi:nucleoside-diphosphate-sugar epimerase